jgi:hypothetical protein
MNKIALATAFSGALATAGCATLEEAVVEQLAGTYNAELTGAQVVGTGDPDGHARAEITVADNLEQLCYDVNNIRGVAAITSINLHRGAPGTNGPVVLNLKAANEGVWRGCAEPGEWLQEAVEDQFFNHYVQVNTTEFPNGAIRGQLRD